MYACICNAVPVDEVERAIDAGATTVELIGERTMAGTTCGSCHDTLEELIRERCGHCAFSRPAHAAAPPTASPGTSPGGALAGVPRPAKLVNVA